MSDLNVSDETLEYYRQMSIRLAEMLAGLRNEHEELLMKSIQERNKLIDKILTLESRLRELEQLPPYSGVAEQ